MEYFAIAFVLLLIWGNLSRRSQSHPVNSLTVRRPVTTDRSLNATSPTAGDSFNSGCTFTPGVPEPQPPAIHYPPVQTLPLHVTFPVDPPPIAIQRPIVTPRPPLRPVQL